MRVLGLLPRTKEYLGQKGRRIAGRTPRLPEPLPRRRETTLGLQRTSHRKPVPLASLARHGSSLALTRCIVYRHHAISSAPAKTSGMPSSRRAKPTEWQGNLLRQTTSPIVGHAIRWSRWREQFSGLMKSLTTGFLIPNSHRQHIRTNKQPPAISQLLLLLVEDIRAM